MEENKKVDNEIIDEKNNEYNQRIKCSEDNLYQTRSQLNHEENMKNKFIEMNNRMDQMYDRLLSCADGSKVRKMIDEKRSENHARLNNLSEMFDNKIEELQIETKQYENQRDSLIEENKRLMDEDKKDLDMHNN